MPISPACRPLEGVRVLDLSRLIPGPLATLVLADLGATVDKIEDSGQGDYLRHMPPEVAGTNVAYGTLNRGKRSAVLDLKLDAGREALLSMLGSYDVLFEQFRPGVLARLGLDPEELRRRHPRLVLCSLTGYGQTGPYAGRAGHDLNYLARSGLLGAMGPSGQPPAVPGFQLADVSGGLWSVIGILAALRERDRSGLGAWVDIAMSESTLLFAATSRAPALAGQAGARGEELLTGGIAPYRTYATSDGRAVALAALEPKFYLECARALGVEPTLDDLRPGPHQAELVRRYEQVFASKSFAEWVSFCASRDIMLEPVLAPSELRGDEQLSARGMFFDLETEHGKLPQVRTPVTPEGAGYAPPPRQGEHTRSVLAEAGLYPARIDALMASGAAR